MINVADAAIGLRRASKTKEMWTKKYCVFYCCRCRKKMSNAHRWRSSKKTLGHSTRKNKSNYLEPHFPTSATKSRSLEDTKTAVALPHCSESTRYSIAGWWTSRVDVTPELRRKHVTSYVKKKKGGGASSRGFLRKIGISDFFLWAMQHTCVRSFFLPFAV